MFRKGITPLLVVGFVQGCVVGTFGSVHLMAASGFALPFQTGDVGWRSRQPYEKPQYFRKVELQGRRRRWAETSYLELGLGLNGCASRAAAKHDPGYKNPKRKDSKKTEKFASVAEAPAPARQQSRKLSRVEKNQVTYLGLSESLQNAGLRTLDYFMLPYFILFFNNLFAVVHPHERLLFGRNFEISHFVCLECEELEILLVT